jgi:hypothetical protein
MQGFCENPKVAVWLISRLTPMPDDPKLGVIQD